MTKLSGKKLYIILKVSVVQVFRQETVRTACLCCVMSGASLSWKAQIGREWNHLKACSLTSLAIDAVCRLRILQEFLPKHLHEFFFSCIPGLLITLWLGFKSMYPQREPSRSFMHITSSVRGYGISSACYCLGSHQLPLR